MTDQLIWWVVSSNFLLLISCILFFRKLLKKLLKQQREELEQACENRIGELQHYYNHYGILPVNASLRGMLNLISLGIGRPIASLQELLKNKDWNTLSVIEELYNIRDHDLKRAIKLADAIDAEDRRRLEQFKYKEDDTERIRK